MGISNCPFSLLCLTSIFDNDTFFLSFWGRYLICSFLQRKFYLFTFKTDYEL